MEVGQGSRPDLSSTYQAAGPAVDVGVGAKTRSGKDLPSLEESLAQLNATLDRDLSRPVPTLWDMTVPPPTWSPVRIPPQVVPRV